MVAPVKAARLSDREVREERHPPRLRQNGTQLETMRVRQVECAERSKPDHASGAGSDRMQ